MKGKLFGKRLEACWLIATVLLGVAGCGEETASVREYEHAGESQVIDIWAWDENYNIVAVNEAIEIYQKQHPSVEFAVTTMSQEEVVAKLNAALLTSDHQALPDIVLIEDYRVQGVLAQFSEEFEELNDIVNQEDFASCKTGVNHYGDKVYGVPFDGGTVGMFYRLDIIEAAGYSEEDMQDITWEEYIEIGKKVKERTGVAMLTMNPSDLPLVRMMLQSAGNWYTHEDGSLYFEGNEVLVEALRIYKELVEANISVTVADWDQFIHGFWDSEVATVISGSWVAASIVEQQEQSGLWRVAAVPKMENIEGAVSASCVGGSGWYVLKYAGNAGEAKQFLKETFASDTELLNELAEEINLVSTLKKARKSENYKKGQEFFGGQKIYQLFIDWTYQIPQVNYGMNTYDVEELVADAFQKVLDGEEIEQVLGDYQREYEEAYK